MRKHRLINIYLACTIFVIQITGLHLHAHEHTAQHQSPEPETIHIAVATDHVGDPSIPHDQDEDSIVSGPGIIKKVVADGNLLGPIPSNAAPQILLAKANHPTVTTASSGQLQTQPHIRPLLRAPPAHQSI